LHYDTIHCINAIIMIIIVIDSPPREAHYPDLSPFAYILHISHYITCCLHFSSSYISQPPSPAGQAGEASRPELTNLKTSHNFSGKKGLKTGGDVELAGLPAPPTSHTLHLYPLHPSPTFPLSKLYCWKLRNSPDLS